jgi:hypothetical protein
VAMALSADNVVIYWGDVGMRFGCVVRVESTGQDSTMSLWMSLARGGCNLGIPYVWYLWRVHVRGVYPREATLWDGGAIEAWCVGYPHLRRCLVWSP